MEIRYFYDPLLYKCAKGNDFNKSDNHEKGRRYSIFGHVVT